MLSVNRDLVEVIETIVKIHFQRQRRSWEDCVNTLTAPAPCLRSHFIIYTQRNKKTFKIYLNTSV